MLIAKTTDRSFNIVVQRNCHDSQQGFISGRNFLGNAVALEAHPRASSYRDLLYSNPIVLTFDFATAFASIFYSYPIWLFAAMKIPADLVRLLLSFYWYCMSHMEDDSGSLVPGLLYLSGIIQGCPLSGSIFALPMDRVLRMMHHSLSRKAAVILIVSAGFVVKACADDIGVSLARLALLEALYVPFLFAHWATGLTLKPLRCRLVVSGFFQRAN